MHGLRNSFRASKVLIEELRDPMADSVHLTPKIQLQIPRSNPYQHKGNGSRGVENIYLYKYYTRID